MPLRLVFLRNVDRNGPVGFDGGTMSKSRELLERVLAGMDKYGDINYRTLDEIRAYLAEPEKRLKPLSEEELEKVMIASPEDNYFTGFEAGVRFAEKHHGIGGEDDSI